MGPVGMTEARRRLTEIVRAAERGETIVITRRGKRVARIGPVLERPRRGFPDLTEFRESIRLKGEPMSRTVIEMRREERG